MLSRTHDPADLAVARIVVFAVIGWHWGAAFLLEDLDLSEGHDHARRPRERALFACDPP